MAVALPPTRRPDAAPNWIVSARLDLALIIAAPLLIFAAISTAQQFWTAEAISAFVVIWAIGHHLPGMMRAYGDPALRQRYRSRLLGAPILFMSLATASYWWSLGAVFVMASLWGWWHYLMQTYGFLRIYDAKRGVNDSLARNLDLMMCVSWFAAAVLLSDNGLYGFLDPIAQCGVRLPGPLAMDMVRNAAVLAVAAITLMFLMNIVWNWQRGRGPNLVKLLLMTTTFAYFWYCNATLSNILVSYALFELFHDTQYLALVWAFNRNRVQKDPQVRGFIRWLFRPRAIWIGLYLALVFGYGSLEYGAKLLENGTPRQLLLGFFLASTLLHYYFDGFIWKLRDDSTQQSLDIPRSQASTVPSWAFLPRLRPIGYGAVLVVPLVLLTMTEITGFATPIQQRENLVTTMPRSIMAHYHFAVALESDQEFAAAIDHYDQALRLRPQFDAARQSIGRALTKRAIKLASQGQLRDAELLLRRALEFRPGYELANNKLLEIESQLDL